MKQVTIKDIAREAGVSIASVSRALNGMDGISGEKTGAGYCGYANGSPTPPTDWPGVL